MNLSADRLGFVYTGLLYLNRNVLIRRDAIIISYEYIFHSFSPRDQKTKDFKNVSNVKALGTTMHLA